MTLAMLLLFAQVSYAPQPIAFGAVKLGATSATLSSTLTNTGTDTLRFTGGSSMTGSPAFQYVTDNCTARPPGTTCVLQYRFTPTKVGPLTGANVVGTNHGFFPLNFTGTGVDTVTPPPVSTSDTTLPWTLASRVHTRDSVCAHATVTYAGACGTKVAGGMKGTITGGPGKDVGWTFWLVRFDNSVTGWARQALLALDTLGVPPPPPPPLVSVDLTCQTVPPPVGCGLRAPVWAAMGIAAVAGTYGPWYILDSLGRPRQVVRIVVRDTTPSVGVVPVFRLDIGVRGDSSACQRDAPNVIRCALTVP